MADKDKDTDEQKTVSPIKKLLVPLLAAIVVTGATVGALSFFGVITFSEQAPALAADAAAAEGEEKAAPGKGAGTPAFFYSFHPDLLVNFNADGRAHYLKVSIDVMSRDEDAIKGVEEYHSILRNNLLKIFQQVKYETVKGQEGMESMQEIALEEVKRVLAQYYGNDDVEGVYFTTFVVQ